MQTHTKKPLPALLLLAVDVNFVKMEKRRLFLVCYKFVQPGFPPHPNERISVYWLCKSTGLIFLAEFHHRAPEAHLPLSSIKCLLARQQAQMYASGCDECHKKRE